MTATLNVNLRLCTCQPRAVKWLRHASGCGAPEVLIPCPVPGSFTAEVVLSPGCYCDRNGIGAAPRHVSSCPARPIRVSCSIRPGPPGQAWAGSTVSDCEPVGGIRQWDTNEEEARALAACSDRWAIVVALVTGHTDLSALLTGPLALELLSRRDAAFAALAAKALSERADDDTTKALAAAIPGLLTFGDITTTTASDYLSAIAMRRYVSRLIEQVGVLS